MSRRNADAERVQLPVIDPHTCRWTGEWKEPVSIDSLPKAMTLEQLRDPARYWIVSDAEIKKATASWPNESRTMEDIYRENRRGRLIVNPTYKPRQWKDNPQAEYLAWCEAQGHEPHPASIDPEHPIAKQRLGLRYVQKDTA